jgi:hypothetical protein
VQNPLTSLADDVAAARRAIRRDHGIAARPRVLAAEPGERWPYCYPDDETVEY